MWLNNTYIEAFICWISTLQRTFVCVTLRLYRGVYRWLFKPLKRHLSLPFQESLESIINCIGTSLEAFVTVISEILGGHYLNWISLLSSAQILNFRRHFPSYSNKISHKQDNNNGICHNYTLIRSIFHLIKSVNAHCVCYIKSAICWNASIH